MRPTGENVRRFPGALRGFQFVFVAAFLAAAGSAEASIVITVDKSQQRMTVSVDGMPRYSWAVSTGRVGHDTPGGIYRPRHLAREWFSKKYDNSPMPYSIFFHRGIAIHGSSEVSRLGRPASHGCIRLHPSNAARLFALVESQGASNTRIIVTGSSPASAKAPRRTKQYGLDRNPGRSRSPDHARVPDRRRYRS